MAPHHTVFLIGFLFPASLLCACGTTEPYTGIAKTPLVAGSATDHTVKVIPGPEYEAGWLHRFFFGDHYRDVWTRPVDVAVLDLANEHGGLLPLEAGGGFQTKSLRFRGGDGRYYKFRSVDKNPRAVLPLELRETVAADIAQDHISTSHPCAALIVDELCRATGVPHLNSRLVYLPESTLLGEFREGFGGLLGILEEYPEDAEDSLGGFLGATKIRNTLRMFEEMDENSEDRPDPVSFLKARFLDIFVGDWDRHVKQWKWAEFRKEGRKTWLPIPMDRDQAMVRLDGLLPSVAEMSITQFTHFSGSGPDVYKLTFSGQYLDRRLLTGLEKHVWDSVAAAFVNGLTDETIERAVLRLPQEYYGIDGERLVRALTSRRDSFHKTAEEFYLLLAGYVDIHLSDKREYVEVQRHSDGSVEVSAWRRDRETGGLRSDRPVFHRVFTHGETEEIRLYLLGGDDRLTVSGEAPCSITVRVVGGKGDDEMVDRSRVDGMLLGFIPFASSARSMTYFYDHQGENSFQGTDGMCIDQEKYEGPPGGTAQY
jgi:hypothetical protein